MAVNAHKSERCDFASTLDGPEYAVVEGVFPILQDMHTRQFVATAQLPPNHSDYPGSRVAIGAYYMNKADPASVGVWSVNVEGRVAARLHSMLAEQGRSYDLSVRRLDGSRPVWNDVVAVVGLVGALAATRRHGMAPSHGLLGRLAQAFRRGKVV